MNKSIEQLISEYEEIKLSEKELKDKGAELKTLIEEQMPEDEEIETPQGGTIMWKERANYEYSESLQSKQKEVKELEKEEVATGIAINKPTRYVEYRAPKKS